jgi:sugar/nucleoside kinase (ribokinase family)
MTPFNVVSFGDLVTDIVISIPTFPVQPGKHQMVERIQVEPGGAGNFIIAGARLGMEMVPLGVIGCDSFGEATLDILKGEGINVGPVICQVGGTTTTVFVLVDQSGQHVFLGQYGSGPELNLSEEWKAALEKADAINFLGYTFQEERLVRSVLQAMTFARQRGRLLFFDPGPYMQTAPAEQRAAVLASCQVILLTEDEISSMTGGRGGIEEAHGLLNSGVELVCIKRGAQGCVIINKDETVMHPGFPVEVRDTTAAGDSFAAAFIFAFLSGWPLATVAVFANAMGAAKVRKLGSGRQVPDAGEVREVLKRYEKGFKF